MIVLQKEIETVDIENVHLIGTEEIEEEIDLHADGPIHPLSEQLHQNQNLLPRRSVPPLQSLNPLLKLIDHPHLILDALLLLRVIALLKSLKGPSRFRQERVHQIDLDPRPQM